MTHLESPQLDHGWAWVVAFCAFVVNSLAFGVCWSVGVFNVVFLEEYEESRAATAWIGSINTAAVYVSALVCGVLINRFGWRAVTIAGGILSAVGFIASVFATSIMYLCVSFGVLVGFGLGFGYFPSVIATAHYFEKKRNLAMGVGTSGVGFGMLVYPPIYRLMVEEYGWRQSMLISAGIMLNFCACGAAFFPLKNHPVHVENKPKLFRMSMLRKENFTKLCINNLLFCLGLSALFLHIPAYVTTLGNSDTSSSLLISIIGAASFSGRILFGSLMHFLKLCPVKMYIGLFLLCGTVTMLVPLVSSYEYIAAYCALLGLLGGTFGVFLPAIITKFVGLHRMTNAYGFIILYEAAGALIGAPAAGWIYDRKQSYLLSFYFAGGLIVTSALILMVPPITERLGLNRGGSYISRKLSMKKTSMSAPNGGPTHQVIQTYLPDNTSSSLLVTQVSEVSEV